MARLVTWGNGTTLFPAQLDSIEDDYECAFGTYKTLAALTSVLQAPAAGTYVLSHGYSGPGLAASSLLGSLWLDPARYWSAAATSTVNPRSVYYNLGLAAQTNATAVGTVGFTVGLTEVSAAPGTLAAGPVSGSTVVLTDPAASALEAGAWSGDFAAPAAGLYVPTVTVSAAAASGSEIALTVTLQVRQV